MTQGSGATGDCCSKCWNDLQKKQGGGVAEQPTEMVSTPAPVVQCLPTSEPSPMEVDDIVQEEIVVETVEALSTASTPLKKKKKKASYKSMMASMLQSSSPSRDLEQEKESLRKVTGGGAFSKIDKI